MLLLAKGSCRTPRAQKRYDVFFRKGYEVSDITEVLSIQIVDVSRPVSEVKSSGPSIMGQRGLTHLGHLCLEAPVAGEARNYRGRGSHELVFFSNGSGMKEVKTVA